MLRTILLVLGVLAPVTGAPGAPGVGLLGRAPQGRDPVYVPKYECLDSCLVQDGVTCPQPHVCTGGPVCTKITRQASFRCFEVEGGSLPACQSVPENEWCFLIEKNPCDSDDPSCYEDFDGCGSKYRCDT